MQDKTSYNYDFSYSLALDPIQSPEQPPEQSSPSSPSSLQHKFSTWLSIYSQIKLAKQCGSSCLSLLYRLPAYRKLGNTLLKLCAILHNFVSVEERQSEIEKLRENVYALWKEVTENMGNDKDKIVNLVTLGLFAILFRVLAQEAELDDQFGLFHTVYWELRGQLTNKQTMEMLISKTFNVDLFHKFMFWDQQQLKQTFCMQKKFQERKANQNQVLSFRASLALQQSKANNKNNEMYQSFKDIHQKLSKKNESKQNISNNYNSISPAASTFTTQEQCSKATNFDNFRKKPNPQTFQESKPVQKPINFTSIANNSRKQQPFESSRVLQQDNVFTARFQDMKSKNQGNAPMLSFRENRTERPERTERTERENRTQNFRPQNIRRELFRKV